MRANISIFSVKCIINPGIFNPICRTFSVNSYRTQKHKKQKAGTSIITERSGNIYIIELLQHFQFAISDMNFILTSLISSSV